MFCNLKFDLLTKEMKMGLGYYPQYEEAQVTLLCGINPVSSQLVGDGLVNLNNCRTLETRLSERYSHPDWNALLKIALTTDRDFVNSVSVHGTFLEKLQSVMSYGTADARLKLKLISDILVTDYTQKSKPSESKLNFQTALYPRQDYGQYDHSEYRCAVKNSPICMSGLDKSNVSWDFSSIRLHIEGIEHDSNASQSLHTKDAFGTYLMSEFTHRLRIVYKENSGEVNTPILASGALLFAKSPVIKTMHDEGKFAEGASHELPMKQNSKDEVLAFLDFLYYGDVEKPSNNTSLAVVLYEMGQYYQMECLEKAMKSVLVTSPTTTYEVDDALRLFKVAAVSGDNGIKQLAVDILRMKKDDEGTDQSYVIDQIIGASGEMAKEFLATVLYK